MQRPGGPERERSAAADRRDHQHFPLIEPLRAVAAICVVCLHCAFLSNAVLTSSPRWRLILDHLNVGVTIFFVVSGFVLYRPFVAARSRAAATPSIARYAWRRLLRIGPAYWLALGVLAVVPGLAGVFTHNWWVYFSLLQFYPVYSGGGCGTAKTICGLTQTWSLAIEVAFYVMLPFVALMVDTAARRLRNGAGVALEIFVVVWLGMASLVFRALDFRNVDPFWTFNTVLVYFDWFAVGMLLASVSVGLDGSRFRDVARAVGRHGALLFWAAAVGVFLLLCWVALPATPLVTGQTLAQDMQEHLGFALVALLLVAPAVLAVENRGLARLVLGNPLTMWLGRISYGIFLWHLTIAAELANTSAATWWPDHEYASLTLSVLALTIPISAVSYYLVERPIMVWLGGRRRSSAPVPAGRRVQRAGLPAPVVVAPAFAPGVETT